MYFLDISHELYNQCNRDISHELSYSHDQTFKNMFKTFVSFVNYDARSLKIINSHSIFRKNKNVYENGSSHIEKSFV